MVIHEKVRDVGGQGRWDLNTTRYVPVGGGSRSRLPIADDPEYRRYPGFVGMDEHLTPDIYQVAQLYTWLGGKPVIPAGGEGTFTALILGEGMAHLEQAAENDPPEG